jgi:hypothetical protein
METPILRVGVHGSAQTVVRIRAVDCRPAPMHMMMMLQGEEALKAGFTKYLASGLLSFFFEQYPPEYR